MTAWILTIPVSGLLAAAIYYIVSIFYRWKHIIYQECYNK